MAERYVGVRIFYMDQETVEKAIKDRQGKPGPTEPGWYIIVCNPEPDCIYPQVFQTEAAAKIVAVQALKEYVSYNYGIDPEDLDTMEIEQGTLH